MRKTKKSLAILALVAMLVSIVPVQAFGATTFATDDTRLAGADRYGTAVAVADAGWTSATTAILAPGNDENLVDALAAAPLAGQENAPILLTDKASLNAATKAEITKLGVSKVYVVGAISASVAAEVRAISGVADVEVLQGADRIATAVKIAGKLNNIKGSFVVGYGALPDALSAASYAAANGYSILLAGLDGKIPSAESGFTGAKTYVLGGPTLVADISGAQRIAGADRFATNKLLLNTLTYSYSNVYVANGEDSHLVDSLVASSLAAKANGPIVLATTTSAAAAADVNAKLSVSSKVVALGGTSVVPDAVKNSIGYKTPGKLAVQSVSAINGGQIEVVFNQAVDATSAETIANYTVTEAGGAPVAVSAAELQDDDVTVILTFTTAVDKDDTKSYAILVDKVKADDDANTEVSLFSSIVSVHDETAPAVDEVEAKTNSDKFNEVTITFSEPIATGAVKIDGKYYKSAATNTDSNELVVATDDLNTADSHTLQVVNLEDRSGNSTDLVSKTFKAVKDTTAPTVSSLTAKSDSQIKVVFAKKMDEATVIKANIGVKDEAYADLTFNLDKKSDDDTNTIWTITVTKVGLYDDKDSRVITVVFSDSLKDSLGNEFDTTVKNVTLTKDTVAPTVTGLTFNADSDDNVTKVIATFSENINSATIKAPTVIDADGVLQVGFFNAPVVDDNKVTYPVKAPADFDGKWTFTFDKGTAQDKAISANDSVAYTGTLDFGAASTSKFKFEDKGNVSTSLDGQQNIITVNYGVEVKGGAVIGSATDGKNYSLNGLRLDGATITLDVTKSIATIKVPKGSVVDTDSNAVFTINNVKNADGTTITAYTTTVSVQDDTKPVLKAAQIVGNTLILTFSEKIADPTKWDFLGNFEIKAGSDKIEDGVAAAALVAGDSKKVQLTFTIVPTKWDTDKTITVKTLDTTTAADLAGNKVVDGTIVTATK